MTPQEQADEILNQAVQYGCSINEKTALFLRNEIAGALLKQSHETERLKSALRQIVTISSSPDVSFEQRMFRMRAEAKLTLNEWQAGLPAQAGE